MSAERAGRGVNRVVKNLGEDRVGVAAVLSARKTVHGPVLGRSCGEDGSALSSASVELLRRELLDVGARAVGAQSRQRAICT